MLIKGQTNSKIWDALRCGHPNFKNITAKGTEERFTENGYEQLKNNNPQALNEFFNLSLRTYLQQVNISHVKDFLGAVGETYHMPLGTVIQRLSINPINGVTPAFHNLQNGASVDPFIVRKPDTKERFWHNPNSFQNMITLQDFQVKQIFISEYGMSEFLGGILVQLEDSLRLWKVENKLNAISVGINSTDFPLQQTQSIATDFADLNNPTDDELKNFLLTIKQTITNMTVVSRTNSFNANKFSSVQDKGRLKLLIRRGMKDQIDIKTMVGAFNPEYLNLGIDIIEVPNFGGLIPYQDAEFNTMLYPAYDERLGYVIGWNTEENQTEATVGLDETIYYKDPNENVTAILMDKGWMFETITNEVRSDSIWNPRGLYMNHFISMVNYYVSIDSNYNVVVFSNTKEA